MLHSNECGIYYNLFINSSANGHLGYFLFYIIRIVQLQMLLDVCCDTRIFALFLNVFSLVRTTSFPKCLYQIHSHQRYMRFPLHCVFNKTRRLLFFNVAIFMMFLLLLCYSCVCVWVCGCLLIMVLIFIFLM